MKFPALGTRIYAAGVSAIAIVNLALGTFDPTQPVPASFPGRAVLSYVAAVFLLIAGAGVAWRPSQARAAAALSAYYAVVVVLLMNGSSILAHHAAYGDWFGAVEGLALSSAALIIYANDGEVSSRTANLLTRVGQCTIGLCVLYFGGAHFVYPANTIPLVPKWLPPSQAFWAYATGMAQIAAATAILTGIMGRLAAMLLAVMYASFTPLVHLPLLLGDSSRPFFWTENALNIALVGVACVVAESFVSSRLERPRSGEHLDGLQR